MSLSSSEAEGFSDEETSPQTFGKRLVGFASGFGEALARTAASATVLLSDTQLRRQGASVLSAGASKGLRGVQSGVVAGVQRLQSGPKQLRAALARVQRRIEEERLAGLLRVREGALLLGCLQATWCLACVPRRTTWPKP